MTRAAGYPHNFWRRVGEFLFPAHCIRCGVRGTAVCQNCKQRLHQSPSPIHGIIVALAYRDRFVRDLLWRLKYKGEQHIAEILAEILFPLIEERLIEFAEESPLSRETWIVIGAPSARARVTRRGYNHADLLALHIAGRFGEPCVFINNALYVARDISQQAKTGSRDERERNIRGAFATTSADVVRGSNIIVIDDITTTGATLRECERVLRMSGARRILLAAIAH